MMVILAKSYDICSPNNLERNGISDCGDEWWTRDHSGWQTNFNINVTDMAIADMYQMVVNSKVYRMLNASTGLRVLKDFEFNPAFHILPPSVLPYNTKTTLNETIEAAMLAEPFLLYTVADLLIGQKISVDELETFGLPTDLADRSSLQHMYERYFDASCTK